MNYFTEVHAMSDDDLDKEIAFAYAALVPDHAATYAWLARLTSEKAHRIQSNDN
jgi:hypothetical protein